MVFFAAAPAAHANLNDALETQNELLQAEQPHGTSRAAAPEATESHRAFSRWSLSNMTMWSGPAVNNLDGHLTTSSSASGGTATTAGNSQPRSSSGGGGGGSGHSGHGHGSGSGHQNNQPTGGDTTAAGVVATTGGSPAPYSPGSSLRNTSTLGYHFDETYSLGPVVTVSEKLYGSNQHVLLEDPQMRFSIADILRTHIGRGLVRASLWFSLSAPLSDRSVAQQNVTTFRTSFSPRYQPAGTDFSFSLSGSAQVGFYENDTSFAHVLMPQRYFAGVQTSYRLSRVFTPYVMTYMNQTAGPTVAQQVDDPTLQGNGQGKKYGLMTGLMYKPTSWMSVSPRANWQFGQPLNTTTVGMNANFVIL